MKAHFLTEQKANKCKPGMGWIGSTCQQTPPAPYSCRTSPARTRRRTWKCLTQKSLSSSACSAHWRTKGFTGSLLHNRSELFFFFQLLSAGFYFTFPLKILFHQPLKCGYYHSRVQLLPGWTSQKCFVYLLNHWQCALSECGTFLIRWVVLLCKAAKAQRKRRGIRIS